MCKERKFGETAIHNVGGDCFTAIINNFPISAVTLLSYFTKRDFTDFANKAALGDILLIKTQKTAKYGNLSVDVTQPKRKEKAFCKENY